MRAAGPTLRLDPGWLFVAAGLALCAAGILAPAHRHLRALETQRARLAADVARGEARQAAHRGFLDRLDRGDPTVIRRLAVSQLNLIPAGDRPLLEASSRRMPVTDWIDGGVPPAAAPPPAPPETWLDRFTNGPRRLWLPALGVLLLFVGLLLDGGPSPARRARHLVPNWSREQFGAGEAASEEGEEDDEEDDEEDEEEEYEDEDEDPDDDEDEDDEEDDEEFIDEGTETWEYEDEEDEEEDEDAEDHAA